jgi:hypothetical protein
VWALRGGARVPLAHISGARVGNKKVEAKTLSLRLAGSYVPRLLAAGLYRTKGGGRQLWAVHRGPEVLVVDLHDERWDRLVLQVSDPAATAAAIATKKT